MKWHFKEPRPQDLSDDEWFENVRAIEWLAELGLLGMEIDKK